ncbi:hypothetical protein ACJMK2_043880 [Sinanodonta woodiana]|uniref:Uncharacterized protein n=1 Tax=Sinanodonta woodiana TaxID=1069815 RepID=A0ABD3W1I3_SINWO
MANVSQMRGEGPNGTTSSPQGAPRGHQSRMHLYFNVVVENGALLAFHNKGVQLIDFSGNDTAPKLTEVLAALEAQGINMKDISGLQNAGPRKMMLYPVDESKPILNMETIDGQGTEGPHP